MSSHYHFGTLISGQIKVYFDTSDDCANTARDHVLQAVAIRTGIPARRVLGKSRRYSVVYARKLTAAGLRALGFTYGSIGMALDRHHATIMHSITEIYGLARFDELAAADLVWAIHAADELAGTSARKESQHDTADRPERRAADQL